MKKMFFINVKPRAINQSETVTLVSQNFMEAKKIKTKNHWPGAQRSMAWYGSRPSG